MTYIRKGLSVALAAIVLFLSTCITAYADSNVIYQTSGGVTPVTSGATLETITRFTDNGWLSVNVLRVDLTNPDVKVDTMVNSNAIRTTASTKAFAQTYGAVAAINGGFFEWTDVSGVANPIGPVLKDGNILTAAGDYNKEKETFAAISISKLNEVFCNYLKIDMSLVSQNGNTVPIARYNRPYYGYKDISILDRKWGTKSIGTDTPKYGCVDILEMVVVNGVVVEIRQGMPAIDIPENGYVVVTRKSDTGDRLILDNFQLGDSIQFNISTNPGWDNLKSIISGGAVLLKDGKVPQSFSHTPEGGKGSRNPRTSVGSTKDGRELLLVTIDGRQNRSIGVTQSELAQIMSELGAYNAINLDGGGSTTMVARAPGLDGLNIINTPSDGSLRKVNTAVGVFSTAQPTNELAGIFIDTVDDNIFVNTSRAFTLRGHDKYYNPVPVELKDVKWSVSGVKGTFKENVFYPTTLGRGKIKATIGTISKEIEVSVLSAPVQLELSQSTLKLPLNKATSFTIKGKNKNGYYATISPTDVKWTVKGDIGTFSKGVFTALKEGTGYIDAAIGSTHAYCAVSVQVERTAIIGKFEDNSNTFLTYPQTVPGSYEVSTEQKYSGNSSGKITYDFSNVEASRAAYVVFKNQGLTIQPNSTRLGMWVYNDHENPNWLGAWVYDAKGKQNTVYFTKEMNWVGWKFVEASLEGITSPSKVARVYIVQPNPVADSGTIYLDELSVTTSKYPVVDTAKIPKNTVPKDEDNKSVTYKKSNSSFRFTVFGQSREPKNSLEKLLVTNLVNKVNSTYEVSAFVGQSEHAGAKAVKKPLVSTNKGYKSYDMANSRFIQLDMSKNGLRTSDAKQWRWLLDQLDTAKGSNVFLFLANSPDTFSDSQEAKLFKTVLTEYKKKTGKNVWVFYKGSKNESTMEQGVKYISTTGYEVDGLTQKTTSLAKCIVVTVNGSTVPYEFKSIT